MYGHVSVCQLVRVVKAIKAICNLSSTLAHEVAPPDLDLLSLLFQVTPANLMVSQGSLAESPRQCLISAGEAISTTARAPPAEKQDCEFI